MPRNVEIKACVKDLSEFKSLAQSLSGEEPVLIKQQDTFFNVSNGRLKLRVLEESPSQLIFYSRSDQDGPKLSDYHISQVNNPAELRETLRMALGLKGEVRKQRWLYLVGQTRIHVDQVEGLGSYMELEVVLRDDQTVEDGDLIASDLMSKLKVTEDQLVKGAYMDLILQQSSSKDQMQLVKS